MLNFLTLLKACFLIFDHTLHFAIYAPQRDFTFEGMLASLSALMMLLLSSAVVG